MEVSNILDFIKSGVEDCRISSIFGLMLGPQGGAVASIETLVPGPLFPALSLEAAREYLLILLWIGVEIGMDPSTQVLLIFHGVLLVHELSVVVPAKISFTIGVSRICDISLIVRFILRGKADTSTMVRPLNNFWSKITLPVWVTVSGPFLVWVTVSVPLLVRVTVYGSLVWLPCASLMVDFFNS